ncbi:MAG: putative toxin-antitoxin system toxin component, PIN family [Fibromonadaceae bacterium]|jgi:putative PIN family toxin of toxin-antitoxin system|nr:putative toxin-antitoxin system toxin component, PIN family [Fibromonadaceae bacterium]
MPEKQNKSPCLIKIVLDTNILVSSLMCDKGASARILDLVEDDVFIPYYTTKILEEYTRVLKYPRLKIKQQYMEWILLLIEQKGICMEVAIPSKNKMIDESDRMFYDLHKVAEVILITGNSKHYPKESSIMNPADFMKYYNSISQSTYAANLKN